MSTAMGTVHGSLYTKCRNALSQKAQHVLVRFPGGSDIRTVQQVPLAGVNVNPVSGSLAIMQESGPIGSLRFVVASDDFIKPTVQPGEVEIYSSDGLGGKMGRVQVRASGLVYIGNTGTGFDLRSSLVEIIQGFQLGSYSGGVFADTSGHVAAGLTKLTHVLDTAAS